MRMFNFQKGHLPIWLEHNQFFRTSYAICRSFLYNRNAKGAATDEIVGWLIQEGILPLYEGFYVDVGCYHPMKFNTTFQLHRKHNYRGINIDIDDVKIQMFNIRRPKDINICCAVSDSEGIRDIYRPAYNSDISSVERAGQVGDWRKSRIRANTLQNIIDKSTFKNWTIDFLSIDVEGHELAVLKGLDLDLYKPRVICVETWDRTIDLVLKSTLYRFLVNKSYILTNWTSLNLIFRRKDITPISKNPDLRFK